MDFEHHDHSVIIQDRRKDNPMSEVLMLVRETRNEVKDIGKKLENHLAEEPIVLGEEIAVLMRKAFPEGDPDGHRRSHEAAIRAAEERAEFWSAMRKEVGKWGLISVLGFLVVSAWHNFLQGPR